jgi:GTP-binding protein Era
MPFQSGFVSIIGKPNSGKSTLLNVLLGEKISIATRKAQTTRHRIKGILTTGNYQVVFSDTPGIIDPKYKLQHSMIQAMEESLEDADVLLLLLDATKKKEEAEEVLLRFAGVKTRLLLVINKTDAAAPPAIDAIQESARRFFPESEVLRISARQKTGLQPLLASLLALLPEQPPFFEEDELTDRSERFVVSELIREKIFEQFEKEIPYSAEVVIQEWKDEKQLIRIRADITVERDSQKAILLGKGGAAIKRLGTEARKSIEEFLQKKIFLGLTVKVNANWRNNERTLKYLGY